MHNLRYKLIVSDLDGSLLNGEGAISGRTLKAIEGYHAAGGLFTYATGRSEKSAAVFVEQAGIKIPGISFNGGKVFDHRDGCVIYETFLDVDKSKETYISIRKLKKDIIIYFDDARYVAEYTAVIDKYLERVRHEVIILRDIEQVFGGAKALKKLLIIDPKQEGDIIINTVKPIFGGSFNFVKSDPEYYEILPLGTSKGRALEALAEHLGIELGSVIAIGDHLNDVPMIEAAGLGVAVANAEPEAIAAAGYITASNTDDGVALVIEKLLQGQLPGQQLN